MLFFKAQAPSKPCLGNLQTRTLLLSLPKMGGFCLFAYTGLTDRFRRARGFLDNLASIIKLIRSGKTTCWFWKNVVWQRTEALSQTKMWEVLL